MTTFSNLRTVYKLGLALLVVGLIGAGIMLLGGRARRQQAAMMDRLVTIPVERGNLLAYVEAEGTVRSAQSALLDWAISGEVADVYYQVGETVVVGDVLATLAENSLPQSTILAQADLIDAQKSLEDLLHSQTQQAQAFKALEDARQALEDARQPQTTQAQALAYLAEAQRTLETAQRHWDILTTPPSEASLQQMRANILLTEDSLQQIEKDLVSAEKQLNRNWYLPFESLILYKQIYTNLSVQYAQTQGRYEDLNNRYAELLAPPDPVDVAVAEAALAAATAQLADAQRQWGRVKDGPTPAEIALLEAQIADAQREWERLKDGPTSEDIVAAQAHVAAAQAALNSASVKAPFSGMLTQVHAQTGDQVQLGMPAFRLDDFTRMLVDVQVSELDINRIANGQNVILVFESLVANEYQGLVVAVSPVGVETAGVVEFEVIVELSNADEAIRPGMTASVAIEIGRVEDALLVPNQALRSLDGQRVVYVFGEAINPEGGANNLPEGWFPIFGGDPLSGAVYPLPVEIGISSNEYSEISVGDLREGDEIILNPPSELIESP